MFIFLILFFYALQSFVCDLDKFWLYFSNSYINFRELNQNIKISSIEKLNISDSRKKHNIIISNNLFDVQNLVLTILFYFEIFPDWLFATVWVLQGPFLHIFFFSAFFSTITSKFDSNIQIWRWDFTFSIWQTLRHTILRHHNNY